MSDINEVRERLHTDANIYEGGQVFAHCRADDVNALLDDHARLQADSARLDWLEGFVRRAYLYGVSFDCTKPCEGGPGGFRFMTRHRIDARQPTIRAAIDAAKEVQP